MSLYPYSKYKISIDPESKKKQGFQVGDIVRRQYSDNVNTIYSLMVVLKMGSDTVVGADNVSRQSEYFIGALLEGDAPATGELLDFARMTSMFDVNRSGALYLTASDDDAPYMDVIDNVAQDRSLCYPYHGNEASNASLTDKYSLIGSEFVTGSYSESIEDATRVFTITKNSADNTANAVIGLKQTISRTVANPQRVLVSYKIKASKAGAGIPVSFGYTSGAQMDGTDTISVSTGLEYKLSAFIVDFPAQYSRSLTIDLKDFLTEIGDWCQIADFNMVLLSDIANFQASSRARVGKMTGIIDAALGKLDGYGAYFQSMYATKNVNIAGTLTAGDENGSASTFYVGKIHKNCLINSLLGNFQTPIIATADISPTGIGSVFPLTTAKLIVQTPEWVVAHENERYCFSFWAKSPAVGFISVYQGSAVNSDTLVRSMSVSQTGEWIRYSCDFVIKRFSGEGLLLQITTPLSNVLFSSPQLETGKRATLYQPTDANLQETNDYGAWFNRGGVGGTIQNPLLKFNSNGSISSANESFVIYNDGSGQFANGAIQWDTTGVLFDEHVTLSWSQISNKSIISTEISNGAIKTEHLTANCVKASHIDVNTITALGKITAAEFEIKSEDGITSVFSVSPQGLLKATGAEISGKITAASGSIAGWTISGTSISAGNISINSTGSIRSIVNSVEQWSLNNNGKIYAKDIEISGGKIAGWTIASDSIWNGQNLNESGSLTTIPGALVIGTAGIRSNSWRFDANGEMYIGNPTRSLGQYISFKDSSLVLGKGVNLTYYKTDPETGHLIEYTTDVDSVANNVDGIYDELDSIKADLIAKYARTDTLETFEDTVTFEKGIIVKSALTSEQLVNAYSTGLIEHYVASNTSPYPMGILESGEEKGVLAYGISEVAALGGGDLTLGGLLNVSDEADIAPDGSVLVKDGNYYVPSTSIVDKLNSLMNSVFPLSITSFTGGGTYELGSTQNILLNWAYDREIDRQTVNGVVIDPLLFTSAYNGVSSNISYVLEAFSGTLVVTKTVSASFRQKKYYGTLSTSTITDAQILALTNAWSARTQSATVFDCTGGKYAYYILPTSLVAGIQFWIGGIRNTDWNEEIRTIINASGFSSSYTIFRLANIQTASLLIEVR